MDMQLTTVDTSSLETGEQNSVKELFETQEPTPSCSCSGQSAAMPTSTFQKKPKTTPSPTSTSHIKTADTGLRILGAVASEKCELTPPKVPKANPINPKAMKAWIAAHQKGVVKPLTDLISRVRNVSFSEFDTTLGVCLTKLPPRREGVVRISLVEPGKSQAWVNEIAHFNHGFVADYFLALGEQAAERLADSMRKLPDDVWDKEFEVFILDDGSFSGTQMANNISATAKLLQSAGIPYTIHAVVVFATVPALAKIKDSTQKCVGGRVNMIHGEVIPTAKEIVMGCSPKNAVHKVLKDALWPMASAELQDRLMSRNGLTYFEHKVPNSMSFPIGIAEGQLQGRDPIVFIPATHPPYKPDPVINDDD